MSNDIIFKNHNLQALLAAFVGAEKIKVKVGVLGDKTNREDGELTNAAIGAKHEFGLDGMPQRSFLRMPITEKMEQYLEKAGAFDPEALKKVIEEKTIKVWMAKMGIVAEDIIGDAFDTGGFGQWKASNMKNKKNQQTLVETQQLRNSITSKVDE